MNLKKAHNGGGLPVQEDAVRLQKIARILCWFVAAAAVLVFTGWLFDIDTIKRFHPDWVAMNPATVICFIAIGSALAIRNQPKAKRSHHFFVNCACFLVIVVGALRLLGYVLGHEIGVDQILFNRTVNLDCTGPNRMAPNTGLAFILAGLAVLLIDRETRRGNHPSEYLAGGQGILALLAIFGYAFGVKAFYGVAAFIPMAIHTAALFLVLTFAILFSRPGRGAMSILTSRSAGGLMARRLLPAILILPPTLGALRLAGEQFGLYETEFGVALHAVCMVGILFILVCTTSTSVHRSDIQRAEAGLALRKQSRLLTSVLENLAEGVVVADEAGHFLVWNPAAQQILGRGPDPIPIESWSKQYEIYEIDGVTPFPHDALPLVRAMRGESVNEIELLCRHPGADEMRWLQVSGRPLTGDDGESRGGVVVFRDVTERKNSERQVRESEARYRTVVTTTIDGIITMSDRGVIEFVNPAAERLFGYTAEELIKQKINMLMPSPDREQHDGYLAKYHQTGERHVVGQLREVTARRKDGSTFPMQLAVGECAANGRKLYIGAVQDITERKQAQTALEAAMQSAEMANRAKSDFLATMSHELRTPLNGVIGMMELLLATTLNAEQRRFAWLAKSSGDTLLSLISDILDFSKIEAGKLELEKIDFDLRYAVENIAASFASRAESKGIELVAGIEQGVPSLLRGDPGRLQQILLNLVGNAIKFTESGEVSIRVSLDTESQEDVTIRFVVTDTGPGIPRDRMGRLFQSFSQIDASTTRRSGGSGLGLAICKRLVELMSGRINVDTEVGKGSSFWFTVQLAKQETARQADRPIPTALRNARILVVDDNATNRNLLNEMLTGWKISHEQVSSGREALATLKRAAEAGQPFQIALLDMQMPEMDGNELAELIKADPSIAETLLVLLSSHAADGNESWLAQQGFAASLSKPIRQAQLQSTLIDTMTNHSNSTGGTRTNASASTMTNGRDAGTAARVFRKGDRAADGQKSDGRILLVEDHEISQEVAATMLKIAGYECSVVGNGRLAVEAVMAEPFAAVLMDCQMPEMDGFEATRAIRAAERDGRLTSNPAGRIPIIALTANAIKGDRERCLEAGMDDYLSKPLNLERLIEVIESHVSNKNIAPELMEHAEPATVPAHASPDVDTSSMSKTNRTTAANDSPFDLDMLRKKWGSDPVFCRSLIIKFQRRASADLERIEAHVRSGDGPSTAAAAHGLKGSASYLCAARVLEYATNIERFAAAGDLASIKPIVEKLREAIERCIAYKFDDTTGSTASATAATDATT